MSGPKTSAVTRTARMAGILDMVADRGEISLAELASSFATSQATVRRDLTMLAEQGLIARTHGGARRSGSIAERPVGFRDLRFSDAKVRIARAAASYVPRTRSAIALSGGTTTAHVTRELAHHADLTILTNSLSIANLATGHRGTRVVMTGGILRPHSLELVGSLADGAFAAADVETAILGADGVSASGGITTHDEIEARANHAMISTARRTIVVADSSKIGAAAFARVAEPFEIDLLITDSDADPYELAALSKAGLDILLV